MENVDSWYNWANVPHSLYWTQDNSRELNAGWGYLTRPSHFRFSSMSDEESFPVSKAHRMLEK